MGEKESRSLLRERWEKWPRQRLVVCPSLSEDPQDQGHWVIASTWTPTSRSPPLPPVWFASGWGSNGIGCDRVTWRGREPRIYYEPIERTAPSRGWRTRGEKLMSRMMGFSWAWILNFVHAQSFVITCLKDFFYLLETGSIYDFREESMRMISNRSLKIFSSSSLKIQSYLALSSSLKNIIIPPSMNKILSIEIIPSNKITSNRIVIISQETECTR